MFEPTPTKIGIASRSTAFDLHRHAACKTQRTRFLDRDLNPLHRRAGETDVRHLLGKRLNQVEARALRRCEDILCDRAVIDRILESIAAPGFFEVGDQRDADQDVLLFMALFGAQPEYAAHEQILDQDPVHRSPPARCWPPSTKTT